MLLNVTHCTDYKFDAPVNYALQQVKLTPATQFGQRVVSWNIEINGGQKELSYIDEYNNKVDLLSITNDTNNISIKCSGEIETIDTKGIIGAHDELTPLGLFTRTTLLTKPGATIRKLAKVINTSDSLSSFNELSAAIIEAVKYKRDTTDVLTSAEDAAQSGSGVCQDHTHIMIAAARYAGFPARYVNGYLYMRDKKEQSASHAWAEIYLDSLGWAGFDVSNGISPNDLYIRVAIGLDAYDAAPIRGVRYGDQDENLSVSVIVEQ